MSTDEDLRVTKESDTSSVKETKEAKEEKNLNRDRIRVEQRIREKMESKQVRRLKRKIKQLEIWNYVLVTEIQDINLQLQTLSKLGRTVSRQDIENINASFYSRLDGRYDRIRNSSRSPRSPRSSPQSRESNNIPNGKDNNNHKQTKK